MLKTGMGRSESFGRPRFRPLIKCPGGPRAKCTRSVPDITNVTAQISIRFSFHFASIIFVDLYTSLRVASRDAFPWRFQLSPEWNAKSSSDLQPGCLKSPWMNRGSSWEAKWSWEFKRDLIKPEYLLVDLKRWKCLHCEAMENQQRRMLLYIKGRDPIWLFIKDETR